MALNQIKKTTLTLAAMGLLSTAAVAQSITVYGKLDVGYGVGNGGFYEKSKGNQSKFQQWGSAKDTSFWGIRGSEDLGNGLKISFQLQSAVDPETGGPTSGGFSHDNQIGLNGGFGTVQVGRQKTVLYNMMAQFDVAGKPNMTSSQLNAGVALQAATINKQNPIRQNSMLVYISPEFHGFKSQASVILKNDDVWKTGPNAKNAYELAATYKYQQLTLGLAFRSKPFEGINNAWGLAAKYDFGPFLISGGFTDNHDKVDGKGYYLGVSAPIGAFTVGGQVAYNQKAYVGGDEVKPLAWELFSTYKLSTRTRLYVEYGGINNDAQQYQNARRKYSAAFGMIHTF